MEITFSASIPMIQSAVNIGGDMSTRLKLDVPAEDIAEVLRLSTFGSEKVLRVTVEVEGDETTEG